MTLAERLDQEIEDKNISVLLYNLKSEVKAAYYNAASLSGPVIVLNKKRDIMTSYEGNGLKAHELGHHHSSCGNLLEMPRRLQIKYETMADRWALRRVMPIHQLIAAYIAGARSMEDLSDYLEISPEFIARGLECYEHIYGPELKYNGIVITWDPFNIKEQGTS